VAVAVLRDFPYLQPVPGPAPGKLEKLIGRPAWTVAIAGLDCRDGFPVGRTDVLLLARVEPLAGRARLLSLPRHEQLLGPTTDAPRAHPSPGQ